MNERSEDLKIVRDDYYQDGHWQKDQAWVRDVFIKTKAYEDLHSGLQPEDLMLIVSAGREMGLTPAYALMKIAYSHGNLIIPGDLAKSIVFSSGLLTAYSEQITDADGNYSIEISGTNRMTGASITRSYSYAEADLAGLLVTEAKLKELPALKDSYWFRFPKRMVYYRALGFFLRDGFMHLFGPFMLAEELISSTEIDTPSGKKDVKEVAKNTKQATVALDEAQRAIDEIANRSGKTQMNTSARPGEVFDPQHGGFIEGQPKDLPDNAADSDRMRGKYDKIYTYAEARSLDMDAIKAILTLREVPYESMKEGKRLAISRMAQWLIDDQERHIRALAGNPATVDDVLNPPTPGGPISRSDNNEPPSREDGLMPWDNESEESTAIHIPNEFPEETKAEESPVVDESLENKIPYPEQSVQEPQQEQAIPEPVVVDDVSDFSDAMDFGDAAPEPNAEIAPSDEKVSDEKPKKEFPKVVQPPVREKEEPAPPMEPKEEPVLPSWYNKLMDALKDDVEGNKCRRTQYATIIWDIVTDKIKPDKEFIHLINVRSKEGTFNDTAQIAQYASSQLIKSVVDTFVKSK